MQAIHHRILLALVFTSIINLFGTAHAAICSLEYSGRASINEFFKEDKSKQKDSGLDYVEVKILDGNIASNIYDQWTLEICERDDGKNSTKNDGDGCSGKVPLSTLDDGSFPWLFSKPSTIGDNVHFDSGFDALLLDENGSVIDYVSVNGYTHLEQDNCTGPDLPFPYQFTSSGNSTKFIGCADDFCNSCQNLAVIEFNNSLNSQPGKNIIDDLYQFHFIEQ